MPSDPLIQYIPSFLSSPRNITEILTHFFRDTNEGNQILDFHKKNYHIINVTNGTSTGKYGVFLVNWECTAVNTYLSGYIFHLHFIKNCFNSQYKFSRLLKILMDFKKYNNLHANMMQTHKPSMCYGKKTNWNNHITIESFVAYYGNEVML
tara:strand:+ start:927 stop:1379 length:453 start_codon:yes stop_codon:yes gene_type:complete